MSETRLKGVVGTRWRTAGSQQGDVIACRVVMDGHNGRADSCETSDPCRRGRALLAVFTTKSQAFFHFVQVVVVYA